MKGVINVLKIWIIFRGYRNLDDVKGALKIWIIYRTIFLKDYKNGWFWVH